MILMVSNAKILLKHGSVVTDKNVNVFHPDFQQGRPAYFDITIRNSLQLSYISMSAREAGAAALA